MKKFEQEVKEGTRFEFGKNWLAFLSTLDDERIKEAEKSLCDMLKVTDLSGKRFLDIGSGSGLFSLAAHRLGASVYSFDYDPTSVACTKELKSRYSPNCTDWTIEEASVLDKTFLNSLCKFDIVYSWGVLHHTGDMWRALENIISLVEKGGILFIAIYNDCSIKSKFWLKAKTLYCSGIAGRIVACSIFVPYYLLKGYAEAVYKRRSISSNYKNNRGMSLFYDCIDWLGGLPYEFAKVEDIFTFYTNKGFVLRNIKTTNSTAYNQFIFVKD